MGLSTLSQIWALLRRYLITLYRSPLSSLIRIFVVPAVAIGLFLYLGGVLSGATYKSDLGLEQLSSLFIWGATYGHVYHFVNWLAAERDNDFKSLMVLMGLKRTSHYTANTICMLATYILIFIGIAIIALQYGFKDTQSSSFAITIVYLLSALHLTGWIFVFGSFITSTSYTAIILLLLLMEPLIDLLIKWSTSKVSEPWRPVILFLGSVSPHESLRILSSGYKLCKNCDKTDVNDDQVNQPVYLILIAIAVWTVLAFAFARWFEEVCPWQDDTAVKSPWFCLKFWKSKRDIGLGETQILRNAEYFEQSLNDRRVGINIQRVRKSFKGIPAINDISFRVYRGETTLLLGHNGAGKTTLMNMILGKFAPDEGRILIENADPTQDEVLGVGICPQTSVLDNNLTVRQHLELFADIKSTKLSGTRRASHIRTTLEDVSLGIHADKLPGQLSGGMKRKLSLAMAFVGESSILILDEPSSGLDPDSRVFVWNAIRRYRADRTVLLSTQHMEEADYLGDRIAIMGSGRIICCGSSTFLTKMLGSGYKLRIEYRASKKAVVLDCIRSHFRDAKLSEIDQVSPSVAAGGKDLTLDMVVELPDDHKSDIESKMIKLLEDIERNSSPLGIVSHGLKSSSLEDVLLNTTKYLTNTKEEAVALKVETTKDQISRLANPSLNHNASQFTFLCALLKKHLHTCKQDYLRVFFQRIVLTFVISWLLVKDWNSPLNFITYSPSLYYSLFGMYFIYQPNMERVSKFKTMQMTSHANIIVYWLSQIIMDFLMIGIIIIALVTFMQVTWDGTILVSGLNFYVYFCSSIFLFGLSAALLAYIFSTIFNEPSSAVGFMFLVFGQYAILYQVVKLLGLAMSSDLTFVKDTLKYVFVTIMPSDSISYVIYGMSSKCFFQTPPIGCRDQPGFPPAVYGLVALVLQIFVFGSILYFIERNNIDLSPYFRVANPFAKPTPMMMSNRIIDDDVIEETKKAMALIKNPNSQTSVVVYELDKSYAGGVKAVNRLSFTVNRGECFGLLGVNGAGKTTTFSMLVAEARPDSGRILANGFHSTDNVDAYRHNIGYDPQSNPEMSLSPYEALCLMARLRGLDESSIQSLVMTILDVLDMREHASKPARTLSGGTKRKLALGMALIGNPSLLTLDEPTAGVDPIARRSVWQLLRTLRLQSGVSIIISSHAMEECEAICDRISIMSKGSIRCIGTFLHLRMKYSQGCSVRVQFGTHSPSDGQSTSRRPSVPKKTETPTNEQVVGELKNQLERQIGPSVKLTDSNINSATFSISDGAVKRSVLFRIMRDFRKNNPHMSYMINDSSLEDIFLAMAREEQTELTRF